MNKNPEKEKKTISKLSLGYLRLSQVLLFCGILVTGVLMVCSSVNTYSNTIKDALRQNCEALTANISEVYINKYCIPSDQITTLLQTEIGRAHV